MRIALFIVQRHPVMPVRQPKREPIVIMSFVQQSCLGVDEINQFFFGDRVHSAASGVPRAECLIVAVMNLRQASNWFRI